jgi:hypothetical protein
MAMSPLKALPSYQLASARPSFGVQMASLMPAGGLHHQSFPHHWIFISSSAPLLDVCSEVYFTPSFWSWLCPLIYPLVVVV